jgi:hypothetical protein
MSVAHQRPEGSMFPDLQSKQLPFWRLPIGIFGQLQGCPNGPQELMGSRINVNGNLVPTSQCRFSQPSYPPEQKPKRLTKQVQSRSEFSYVTLLMNQKPPIDRFYLSKQRDISFSKVFMSTTNRDADMMVRIRQNKCNHGLNFHMSPY